MQITFHLGKITNIKIKRIQTIQLIKVPLPNNGEVEENCNTILQTELYILKQAFRNMKKQLEEQIQNLSTEIGKKQTNKKK